MQVESLVSKTAMVSGRLNCGSESISDPHEHGGVCMCKMLQRFSFKFTDSRAAHIDVHTKDNTIPHPPGLTDFG